MKLQLKKKKMKSLIDSNIISKKMTPKVGGGDYEYTEHCVDLSAACTDHSAADCKLTARYDAGYTCVER